MHNIAPVKVKEALSDTIHLFVRGRIRLYEKIGFHGLYHIKPFFSSQECVSFVDVVRQGPVLHPGWYKSNRAALSLYKDTLEYRIHETEKGYCKSVLPEISGYWMTWTSPDADGEDAYVMRRALKPSAWVWQS